MRPRQPPKAVPNQGAARDEQARRHFHSFARARDADETAFAAAVARGFKRLAHHFGVAGRFKHEIGAAIGHFFHGLRCRCRRAG